MFIEFRTDSGKVLIAIQKIDCVAPGINGCVVWMNNETKGVGYNDAYTDIRDLLLDYSKNCLIKE